MLTARKIRQLLAVAIITAVVAVAAVVYWRLPATRKTGPATTSRVRPAELALREIRFTETSNGSSKWTLVAERAEYDTSRKLVSLTRARLTMLPTDNSVGELVIDSARAEYDTENRNVSLSGGVRAKSSTGMEFITEAARFTARQGVVATADPVRFSDGRLTLEGKGMDFRVETSDLRIRHNVTATIRTENTR